MKPGGCFGADEAADVLELPESHPRRVHARTCPRCSALLAEWLAYAAAEPGTVPAADLADAEARLARVLAAEAGVTTARPDAPRAARPEDRPSLWERLMQPAMRPALAFGALALVLGAALVVTRTSQREHSLVLRGMPTGPAQSAVLESAQRVDGKLRLSWRAVPGAETYELRFYSGDLMEVGRVGSLQGTSAELPVATLPFHPEPDAVLLVRLVALAGGDAIATSNAKVIQAR
jgi:hypothetical protein